MWVSEIVAASDTIMSWFLGTSWVGLSLAWEQDSAALAEVWRVVCRRGRTRPSSASQLGVRGQASSKFLWWQFPILWLSLPTRALPSLLTSAFTCLENQLLWNLGVLAERSRSQVHQTVLVCCDKGQSQVPQGVGPTYRSAYFLEK